MGKIHAVVTSQCKERQCNTYFLMASFRDAPLDFKGGAGSLGQDKFFFPPVWQGKFFYFQYLMGQVFFFLVLDGASFCFFFNQVCF